MQLPSFETRFMFLNSFERLLSIILSETNKPRYNCGYSIRSTNFTHYIQGPSIIAQTAEHETIGQMIVMAADTLASEPCS